MRALLALLSLIVMGLLPSAAPAQVRRVAVLDFANTAKDPAVEALGPAIAETLTTKLHRVRVLQVVQRHQLYKLLEDQELSQTDLVDPSQAVYVGKLLGAERVVLGTYVKIGDRIHVTARFVDTATGTVVATSRVTGTYDPRNPDGFWAALDQLARAAIDSLNTRVAIVQAQPRAVPVAPAERIEPTPEEQARLAKTPTKSLEAQEAYGRGLVSYKRGRYTEAAREFERATAIDADYVDAWVSHGVALGNLGQSSSSVASIERAYRLYLALDDEQGQASALGDIGVEYHRQTRYADALIYYARSLTLLEKLGNEAGQAATLHNIALAYSGLGQSAQALAYHDRALKLQEKLGNEAAQATTFYAVGLVDEEQGRDAQALSHYERALKLQEKLGNDRGQAITLNTIGILQDRRRRPSEAVSSFERALKLAEKLGNEGGQAAALDNMAKVYEGQGQHGDALNVYGRSLRLREKLGDELGQARTLTNVGLVYAKQRRYAEALSSYERSLRLVEKLGEEQGQAFVLSNIGDVQRARGRDADALSFYERAFEIADRLGTPERETYRRLRDEIRRQSR